MKRLLLSLLIGSTIACGADRPSPTQPSATPAPGIDPNPPLVVTIDRQGSVAAIAGVSAVTVDASGTAGDKLRFQLEFGDGAVAATPVASHVYAAPGTYTAKVTITDAADRTSTAATSVLVKSIQGTWYHAGINSQSHHFEVRRIAVTSQQGADIRGVFANFGSPDRSFTGRLAADRLLHIATEDGSAQFDGQVPSAVSGEGSSFPLVAHGGTASGQTLTFTPVIGEAGGPPPHAELSLRYTHRTAIRGHNTTFDASGSTGDHLSYGVEYGDGEVSPDAVSKYAFKIGGELTARSVVVDRFGRADAMSHRIEDYEWNNCYGGQFGHEFFNPVTNRYEQRQLIIDRQTGNRFVGRYKHPEGYFSSLTGEMFGDEGVRFTVDNGTIEFAGSISFDPFPTPPPHEYYGSANLRVRGGSADGMTLFFRQHYCS